MGQMHSSQRMSEHSLGLAQARSGSQPAAHLQSQWFKIRIVYRLGYEPFHASLPQCWWAAQGACNLLQRHRQYSVVALQCCIWRGERYLLVPCSYLLFMPSDLHSRLFLELVMILLSTAFPNIAIVQGSLDFYFFLFLFNFFYNRKVAGIKLIKHIFKLDSVCYLSKHPLWVWVSFHT